jgi:hypothetical protein
MLKHKNTAAARQGTMWETSVKAQNLLLLDYFLNVPAVSLSFIETVNGNERCCFMETRTSIFKLGAGGLLLYS